VSHQPQAQPATLNDGTEVLLGSVDLEYRLLTLNSALRRYIEHHFGVTPCPGMRVEDCLAPEHAALWPPLFEQALSQGPFCTEILQNGRTLELALNPIIVGGWVTGVSVLAKDITELKTAKESNGFLATMVESADNAIFSFSPSGEILSWNRGAEAIFGYTADEAIGRPFSMLVLPPTMPEVNEYTQQVVSGGTLYAKAGMGVHKDGRVLHVSVTTWPVRKPDGEVEAISLIVRDVTLQHEAEELKGRLAAIVESAQEAILTVDLDGRVVSWNQSAERMTGYRIEEVLHKEIGFLLPEDVRGFLGRWLGMGKAGDVLSPVDVGMVHKDGHRLNISMSASPIRDKHGKIFGIATIIRDISQRKLLAAKLVEAERKYRSIFYGAVEGMFQTSPEGRFITVNPALARILGYDSPEDLMDIITDIEREVWVDPKERARLRKYLSDHNEVTGFECKLRRRDGEIVWTLLSARRVLDASGSPLFHEGSVQDITEKKRIETRLRDSEELYRETLEQAAIGITHTSFDGIVLWCNPRFAEILGYPHAETSSLPIDTFTHPSYREETHGAIRALITGSVKCAKMEKPLIRKDGSLRWVKVTVSIMRDANGQGLHFISFVEDIQARKDAESAAALANEELRSSEARYRTIFETSTDLITIARVADAVYVDANQAALDGLGYSREEMLGNTGAKLGIWVNLDQRQRILDRILAGSPCRNFEATLRRRNGETFPISTSASAVEIEGVPCVVAITRDVSRAKAAQEAITSLAFYDLLTGLPNRRMLLDKLREGATVSPEAARSTGLLFIDVDNFKALNDTLGYQAGDMLLQEVARRLIATVREYDMVARVGGDEFAVVLGNLSDTPDTAAAQALLVSEKILATIREPFRCEHRECYFTVSVGVDVFGEEPESRAEGLLRAEIAMHQAKGEGRNTIRAFSPAQQVTLKMRVTLEEHLRLAVDNQDFVLYYQPQIERGRLTGAEVLIRWNHPERGLIMPDEFIPLAEETGLILSIGQWAIETACRQLVAWSRRPETSNLTLAVNISASHLSQPDFVDQVLEIVARTGARPTGLRLELTESMLTNNIDDTINKMAKLKAHGLRFSLDDFGTGYSSLSYLKRLPISRLKIDRAFVKDILIDAASGAIAQTIISLGKALDVSVIAEGVETEEQKGYLAALGCYSYQGYLFSPPRPLLEFEAIIENLEHRKSGPGDDRFSAVSGLFEI
jgi:diguanylate cyclase (GGDEF)-like protein/PAS domain S-box-containing protein